MKLFIVVALALVACATAAPLDAVAPVLVKILRSDINQEPNGPYTYSVETENGIVINEQGELKEALDEENKPHTVVVVRGSYSYPGEDGQTITVNYYADETGFHAEGPTIPKNPEAAARR